MIKTGVSPFHGRYKVTPIAPPTECGIRPLIRPVPNKFWRRDCAGNSRGNEAKGYLLSLIKLLGYGHQMWTLKCVSSFYRESALEVVVKCTPYPKWRGVLYCGHHQDAFPVLLNALS